jgi:hypothetical protein
MFVLGILSILAAAGGVAFAVWASSESRTLVRVLVTLGSLAAAVPVACTALLGMGVLQFTELLGLAVVLTEAFGILGVSFALTFGIGLLGTRGPAPGAGILGLLLLAVGIPACGLWIVMAALLMGAH